jgi:hypothetical protein
MRLSRAIALTASLMPLLGPLPAKAEATCRPTVELGNAQLSKVTNLRRHWTATAIVDASKCSTSSGLFAIRFLRWSESGPDLEFTEPFIWQQGERTVRVEFWADEAVGRYGIADVAVCACKE